MGHHDTNLRVDREVSSVKIVIGEENRQVRQALTSSLYLAGFRDILDTDNMTQVTESLAHTPVDLMICSTNMAAGGVHDLLGRLRTLDMGSNPFVVAILLLGETTQQAALKAMAAGPDALIMKPFATGDLLRRISSLTKDRQPFVVTHEYVGPNRRNKHRPGTEVIPVIPVPNPLGRKILKGSHAKSLAQEVKSCAKLIRDLRLERCGRQIRYMVSRLAEATGNGAGKEASVPDLDRLLHLTLDLANRIEESRFAHIHDSCRDLHGLAAKVNDGDDAASSEDLLEMETLANRIDGAFRKVVEVPEKPRCEA